MDTLTIHFAYEPAAGDETRAEGKRRLRFVRGDAQKRLRERLLEREIDPDEGVFFISGAYLREGLINQALTWKRDVPTPPPWMRKHPGRVPQLR